MPVSSPSYFPPSRGTDQIVGITAGQSQTGARVFLAGQSAGKYSTVSDLIIIGDDDLSNSMEDSNAVGTTVVGSQSVIALNNCTTNVSGTSTAGPVTAFGYNILPDANAMGGSVFMGSSIAPGLNAIGGDALGGMVVIGASACSNVNSVQSSFNYSVIIGFQAYQCTNGDAAQDISSCVFIGALAAGNGGAGGSGTVQTSVCIGYKAGYNIGGSSSSNVCIGNGAGASIGAGSQYNTIVGAGSDISSGVIGNAMFGSQQSAALSSYTTLLGNDIGYSGGVSITGSICIGYNAGNNQTPGPDQFIVETNYGGGGKSLLFGSLAKGSIVIGRSTAGTNRDLGGSTCTNITKFLTGVFDGTFPVGGGFLTVNTNGDMSWTNTTTGPANVFASAASNQLYLNATETTGFTVTIANYTGTLYLTPAGTLATGTVTLPPNPIDGFEQRIGTKQTITSLTVSPNSSQSIIGGASGTLSANTYWLYKWLNTLSSWVRLTAA